MTSAIVEGPWSMETKFWECDNCGSDEFRIRQGTLGIVIECRICQFPQTDLEVLDQTNNDGFGAV